MFKIVRREEMAEKTVILNEIEAPLIARKARPGQLVILKADEDGERIPLTMASADKERGTITIIYMVVDKSTALFRDLMVGDGFQDVIGARNKDLLILEEQMREASHDLRLCTDDWSYGHHGFVTDAMREILEQENIRQAVAIGPVPMMRAV